MAADPKDRAPRHRRDDDDDLADLRLLAAKVFIGLSALVVMVDMAGRLMGRADIHVDPVTMGLVFGTMLGLLGLEAASKLLGPK